MPVATELNINTAATAEDMANTMFGDGVTVVSATYSGDAISSGTYSGGNATLGDLSPSDAGVILSTGSATDITNSTGTADTNTSAGTTTNTAGVDGDADLDAVSGQSTFDGAFLEAEFIPVGDTLTMQLVFSSEEYLEYVNGGVNDAVGVWVNGTYVPLEVGDGSSANISIDTINTTNNSNLYVDNPASSDLYNTEMDGATVVLSLTAPVTAGATNTIRIGIADGGDASYDSNLLIMGDSVQAVSIANDDELTQGPNSTQVHNLLANDTNSDGNAVSITHINNEPVSVGDTVTLDTGEQVTLNADGTVTIVTDGDIGSNTFTYSTVDSEGNPATGYATIETSLTPPDYIVEGTGGDDTIDAAYTGDPEGDMIDNSDHSDGSNDDSVEAGAGNDSILSGAGDDTVQAGTGDDTVDAGTGNDVVTGDAGSDTILGGEGDDTLSGGDGLEAIATELLTNGSFEDGTHTANGVNGLDGWSNHGGSPDSADDGTSAESWNPGNAASDGTGYVTMWANSSGHNEGMQQTLATPLEAGTSYTFTFNAISADYVGGQWFTPTDIPVTFEIVDVTTGAVLGSTTVQGTTYSEYSFDFTPPSGVTTIEIRPNTAGEGTYPSVIIDEVSLVETYPSGDDAADSIDGGAGADVIDGEEGDDTLIGGEGNDTVSGGSGDDTMTGDGGDDTMYGGEGDDTIDGGSGADFIQGNEGADSIEGGTGNDTIQGETGNDYVSGGAGDDSLEGNEGDDTIMGGAGDDWVRGSFGEDEIHGGTGDDTLWGGYGDDTIHLENGFGNDIIDGDALQETDGDTLDLSAVTDDLTVDLTDANPENGSVSDGTDTATFVDIENIVLGGGDDTLVLGTGGGADVVSGFEAPTDNGDGTFTGHDVLDVSTLTDTNGAPVNTDDVTVTDDGSGNAVLTFPSGESLTLIGVAPGDVSDPAALEAIGIPQPDYIVEGTGGDDLIDGTYVADPEGDVIDGSDNQTGGDADSVQAGAGNDTVQSYVGDDTVDAGTGDDSVDGGAGDDILMGGEGADTLQGWFDDDSLEGGAGGDSLIGWTGDDTLVGGTGDDSMEGGDDQDVFVMEDGFGNDTIDGGDGGATDLDTLDLSAVTDDLTIDLTDANPENGSVTDGTGTATFGDIENLVLGGGRDTLTLGDGSGDDTVSGFNIADSGDGTAVDQLDVSGLTDADGNPVNVADVTVTDTNGDGTGDAILSFPNGESITLTGVSPSDVDSHAELEAIGIPGLDYIVEGTGAGELIDSSYTGDPEGDMIDNNDHSDGSNDDSVEAGGGDDTVYSGDGDDTVLGGTGDDELRGQDGNDSLVGEAGDDTMLGGSGSDTLDGDAGNDTIDGGSGDDTLVGDEGADSLTGGTGADEIYAGEGDDTINAGEGDQAYGGDGDDWFTISDTGDAGSNDVTIVGGEGDETLGDTLDFNGLIHWDDITYTNSDPGVGGGMSGTATLADGSVVNFSEIENVIICFTKGTRIATEQGLREVQDLRPGDMVITRDNGLQPVRWVGQRTVPAKGSLAPVRFQAGTLGNERDLLVSPQHRMLLQGAEANLLFGESEVLASAKHLINGGSVARMSGGDVTYVHILFDRHEVIYAEGAATESFFPGDAGLDAVDTAAREELFTIFPELRSGTAGFDQTARLCLRAHESRLLRLG